MTGAFGAGHPSHDKIMGATVETVASALRESKRTGETVYLTHSNSLADDLTEECEGTRETEDGTEYYGVDLDGARWSVTLAK